MCAFTVGQQLVIIMVKREKFLRLLYKIQIKLLGTATKLNLKHDYCTTTHLSKAEVCVELSIGNL